MFKKLSLGLMGLLGLVKFAVAGDLATDLGTITTAATDGVGVVSTSQATVIASVFGLVLLFAGAGWIFKAIKKS